MAKCRLNGALLAMSLLLMAHPASATTSCTISIKKIWSGDNGHIWLEFTNSGSAYLVPTDPDREGTLALATTALVAGRQMEIRYTANNIACNATARSDLEGVYLL